MMRPRWIRSHETLLALFLAALAGAIGLVSPGFLDGPNLLDLLKSSAVGGVFALGVLVVLVSGGIDISFTAIGAFGMYAGCSLLAAWTATGPAWLGFLISASIGAGLGLANGMIVSAFRIPTLIVTLGTASAFRGALLAFVGTAIINSLPEGLVAFSRVLIVEGVSREGERVGLSASVVVFAALALLCWWILRGTMLGRAIHAVGSNPEAAERAGIRVGRVRAFAHAFAGCMAGIAGMLHAVTMRNANPFDLVGSELGVIAAVVLGGASISGGIGSVPGTVLGVLTFVTLENSLLFLGVPAVWQRVAIGAVVIVGTAITARARHGGERGGT